MIIESNIGWTDETINAVIGCDKVSDGCKNCYAETGTFARVLRHRKVNPIETWGANGQRVPIKSFAPTLRRLNKLCICDNCHMTYPISEWGDTSGLPPFGIKKCFCGSTVRRIRLFADSNSDWLDEKWPVEVLANFLNEIRLAPNVDVQLLTKRPENFFDRITQVAMTGDREDGLSKKTVTNFTHCFADDWRNNILVPHNVWIGVSVENQATADLRIPQLLKIPAAVRFISCEPLLGPIEFSNVTHRADSVEMLGKPALAGINWVIIGGESGPKRRDVPVESIISIHDQCKAVGVPCYVKQDSAIFSGTQRRIPAHVWATKEFPL